MRRGFAVTASDDMSRVGLADRSRPHATMFLMLSKIPVTWGSFHRASTDVGVAEKLTSSHDNKEISNTGSPPCVPCARGGSLLSASDSAGHGGYSLRGRS